MTYFFAILLFLAPLQAASDTQFEKKENLEITLIGAFGGAELPKESKIYAKTSSDVPIQCPAIHAYNSASHRFAVFTLPKGPTHPFLPQDEGWYHFISIETRDDFLLFRPHSFIDFAAPSFDEVPAYNVAYAVNACLFTIEGQQIPMPISPISIHGNGQDNVMSPINLILLIPNDPTKSMGVYSLVEGNGRKAITYHWLVGSDEREKMEASVLSSATIVDFWQALTINFSESKEFTELSMLNAYLK